MRHLLVLPLIVGMMAGGLPGQRPLVIAHRGASGHLPEHTLASYALAQGMGADYIEPDVVLTKDGVAICLHDIVLERVTDVQTVFPERARNDGRWYARDFTLAEIRQLSVHGGKSDLSGTHRVPTLEAMLTQVRVLGDSLGRPVGVIPEPKRPQWHRSEGGDVVAATWGALRKAGHATRESRAVIQCFELDALEDLHRQGCRLRLAWLTARMPEQSEIDRVLKIDGDIGPSRRLLAAGARSPLVRALAGTAVGLWPWTYKKDEEAVRALREITRVRGFFTDYPEVGLRALR